MMLLSILAPTIRCIWHLPSWKEALVTTVSIDNGTKGTPSFINIKLHANGCIEQLPTLLALDSWELFHPCWQWCRTDATTPNNIGTCSALWEGYNP